ncbi:helix-turn-helix domain-containing protein [Oryzobacter sp. R7]|uniref:helix-turn-helix domain-containing protein n=1 Tax=Oryzobacter faecalis TaxID=3388656 RepID=UPI00398D2CD1
MTNAITRAFADEVRAELARQDISQKAAAAAVGVSTTAWQNYFKSRTRDIPMAVVQALADFLGVPASELLRRAEHRMAQLAAAEDPGLPADLDLAAESGPRERAFDDQGAGGAGGLRGPAPD